MIREFIYIIIVLICLFVTLRYIERRSIYFPMKIIETTPSTLDLKFEDIYVTTDNNIKLNGWFVPGSDRADTILFFHGNGGNISHRIEKISMLHKLGLNVFIIDYRGYGKSQGRPSEKGLYMDAEAAYTYLIEKGIKPDKIILYGESLGAAVAVDLALKKGVKALITENAFTSVKDMTKIIYPFLPAFILESRYDSTVKLRDIDVPKLIIHSSDDEIVPFRLGRKFFEAAAEPKEFLKIRGSHNTAFLDSEDSYVGGIGRFVEK